MFAKLTAFLILCGCLGIVWDSVRSLSSFI